jgi:hypothetical protein
LKRYWETGKTILIFVLIASAVFLAGKTGYFDEFVDSAPALSRISGWLSSIKNTSATPAPPSSEMSFAEAARPVYAVVTGIGGHHWGVKYDGAQLSTFYNDTSNILGESLGSSSPPQAITEGAWRAALTSAGIYFDYLNPIPLSALTRWLVGTDMNLWDAEHSARRICISGSDDGKGVFLYFMDSEGAFYRSQTAVQYSSLAECMAKYLPNNTQYAFEFGEDLNIDPYALIMPGTGRVPLVSLSNPVHDKISPDEILFSFEMNPNLASPYHESGAVVYMMENCSLRLYDSGLAVYKSTGDTGDRLKIRYSGGEPRINELLEGARSFIFNLIGGTSGAAELYYTGHSISKLDGSVTLTFDYFVSGIPVRLMDSPHAATIRISEGVITEARLCFRTFSSAGVYTPALPDLQAAILAGEEGGEPVLEYFESGGDLTPQWTSR